MFKAIKLRLYFCKEWIKSLFIYPRTHIEISESQDYDAYWKDKRGDKIGQLSSWQQERAQYVAGLLKKTNEGVSIADVGCGDGSILLYIKDKLTNVNDMYGFDNSNFALSQAKKNGVKTEFLDISDALSFDKLVDADYYILFEIIEHVPHSEKLLMTAFEHARKGIFISIPNTGFIRHRLRLLFGKFPLQWRVFPNEHVRFWTYRDVRWWLKALNIENYTIHSYRGFSVLNKLLPGLFAEGLIINIDKE